MTERIALLEIRIRDRLLPVLLEMHATAASSEQQSLASFIGELIEAQVADFKLCKIVRDPRPQGLPTPETKRGTGRQSRLTPEKIQRIKFLAARHRVTAEDLAKRFGVAETTVLRYIHEE